MDTPNRDDGTPSIQSTLVLLERADAQLVAALVYCNAIGVATCEAIAGDNVTLEGSGRPNVLSFSCGEAPRAGGQSGAPVAATNAAGGGSGVRAA